VKLIFGVQLLACGPYPCFSAELKPYSSSWPEVKVMSADCREVSGTYVDPNLMHWKTVEQHGGVTSKHDGTLEAAWPLFGFLDYNRLRLNDTRVKLRAFSISFAADGDLIVDYYVDGNLVATRHFDSSKWTCGTNGLQVTTLERKGVISDLIPNDGWSRGTVILFREGGELIVKEINESKIYFLHVIPQHNYELRWYRFPSVKP
jgi:hypothetical protein